jgi:hypothetical protein
MISVMPGLDPGIHAVPLGTPFRSERRINVDGRVKPGHDGEISFPQFRGEPFS